MSIRQWFNPNVPIANTQGLRCIANLPAPATPTFLDLRTIFGGMGLAGRLAIRAVAAGTPTGPGIFKAYYNLSTVPQAVDETRAGVASGICWPIVDGETQFGRIMGGQERATGYATGSLPFVLNYKSAPGGTGSLRLYRVVEDNQDSTPFRIPQPSGANPSGAWFVPDGSY